MALRRRAQLVGLHSQVLAMQLGIVLSVAALLTAACVGILAHVVQQAYEERVLSIAETVALMPAMRDAFDGPDPSAAIQPLAEAVRQQTGLSFVVVLNREGVRYSHPVPERIGEVVSTDPTQALDGQAYVATERGTLGLSVRAKVPILKDGEVIGAVSVGVLTDRLQDVLASYWPLVALVALAALGLGGGVSYLFASHVKRQLFGLEPPEIASLLLQREALLHGIREGVLAVDRQGRVTVANAEARRLLDLPADIEGRLITDVLPRSDLPATARTGLAQHDQQTLAHNGRVIVANRMPVRLRGELIGAISTFRDQTEVQRLANELSGARNHLDALRAQAHEFANKLHTIAGFIELGWPDRAIALINATTQEQQRRLDDLPRRVADPAVAALLVGKSSVAAERGVALELPEHNAVGDLGPLSEDLATILGNLVENAFEATEGQPVRRVRVALRDDADGVRLEVRDSGPGVPDAFRARIFDEGFSTRDRGDGRPPRGIGLALVRRAVERWGGRIEVRNDGGAVFDVWLPRAVPAAPASPARPLEPVA